MASAHMYKSCEREESCERKQYSEHKHSGGGHGLLGGIMGQQHHGSSGHIHMPQQQQGVMCHDGARKQHHSGGVMGMIKQEYKKKDEFKCKEKSNHKGGSEYKCKEKKSYKKKSSRSGDSSSSDSD